ncbi:MAG: hypothetical protein NWF07_12665 [Candidatus Bathyarchaeota archaeon]|nr:hypothetical protein [Candidatus Bathyarchaeota archaeon]
MIELSLIRDLVAIFGVIAGFSYYVLVLRTQNKTRQAQLFSTISKDLSDYDSWLRNRELMYMEWTDYDDFEKKYGSNTNPVSYAQRYAQWTLANSIGVMLKQNLVDEMMVYDSIGSSIIMMWDKFEPIIMEQRTRYMGPNFLEHYEYLIKRMKKIQEIKGIQWKPPSTSIKYVTDQ